MRCRLAALLTLVIPLAIITPANACRAPVKFDPTYIRHADTVVIGRVVNYQNQEKSLDQSVFDIIIDQILVGDIDLPKRLSAVWRSPTFGRPRALPLEPMLIALRNFNAETSSNSHGDRAEVLHKLCSESFIFLSNSNKAEAVRKALDAQSSKIR